MSRIMLFPNKEILLGSFSIMRLNTFIASNFIEYLAKQGMTNITLDFFLTEAQFSIKKKYLTKQIKDYFAKFDSNSLMQEAIRVYEESIIKKED